MRSRCITIENPVSRMCILTLECAPYRFKLDQNHKTNVITDLETITFQTFLIYTL